MSTVTVTPTVELDTNPPRVRLDVTDSNLPSFQEVTVVRLNPDGRTSPVRTSDGNPLTLTTSGANRVGLLYDYEAPFGLGVSYSTVEDPATVSAQVTVDADDVWLIHPGVPELSMSIELRAGSLASDEWAIRQGVFWPMGREYPVVHTDGQRKAPSSSLIVGTETLTDMRRFRTLMRDASPLLLNIPDSLGYGFDTCFIAVGNVRAARRVDIGSFPSRDLEVPFQVVDRPAGGTQAERTYAGLLSFASYSALQAAYGTYQDVLSGP